MSLDYILNKINDLATREQLVEICKTLYEENKKLEMKIGEIEAWAGRAEKYEEHMVSGAGAIVMRHKEKGWYYCPVCFERKSIIALKNYGMGSHCPGCLTGYGFTVGTK